MNHELMCKLNMHDTQVIELMGTQDFSQLQQQQLPHQMLSYTMTETQTTPTAQHADNQDNNRTSRPVRRASRRTPQVRKC